MQKQSFRSCKPSHWTTWCCSLLLLVLAGCEKDDICVDGDTPLLVIRFFDSTQPDTPKAVDQLRVIGLENGNPVPTFADRSNLDSIALPLRPGETETTFILIQDSQDSEGVETGNPDTLLLSYVTREVFVSRACGFIANYEELDSQLATGSENWIESIEVDTTSVQTQDSRHVSIYH
jgi:hypothetical protein